MAQSVAHFIGSEEVTGSIPVASLCLRVEIFDFSRVLALLFYCICYTLNIAHVYFYLIFFPNEVKYKYQIYNVRDDYGNTNEYATN